MFKRYQVFLSSTYHDLRDERDGVMRSLLELGHIPVGMEMFSAADEAHWKLISRTIEDSDYYVVLIARRYGSVIDAEGGISYTEKEYDHAVAMGVPTLAFVLAEDAPWAETKRDPGPARTQLEPRLKSFVDKVSRRIVSYWKAKDDLERSVVIALQKQIAATERPGWIRSDKAASPQALAELSRLSIENNELRARIKSTDGGGGEGNAHINRVMCANVYKLFFWSHSANNWMEFGPVPLSTLFSCVAIPLGGGRKPDQLSKDLALAIGTKRTRDSWPIPSNQIMDILVDLQALGLATPILQRIGDGLDESTWKLTAKGNGFFLAQRLRLLELKLKSKEATDQSKRPKRPPNQQAP